MDITGRPTPAHLVRSGFRYAYALPVPPKVSWEKATTEQRRILSAWRAWHEVEAQGIPFRPPAASQRALGATLAALDGHSLHITEHRSGR